MSNLIINWRFGRWFFQVTRPSDWGLTVDGPVRLKRFPVARSGVSFYEGGRYAALLMAVLVGVVLAVVL